MIEVVKHAPTRHLLNVQADGADLASVEVTHERLPVLGRERVTILVEPDDDNVIVQVEVRPR